MATDAPTTGAPAGAPKSLDLVATEVQSDLYRIRTCANAISDAVDCSLDSMTVERMGDVYHLSELIRMVVAASLPRAEQLEIATARIPMEAAQ